MANSWETLQTQLNKIHGVLVKLSPPEPDDEFENQRRAAIEQVAATIEYTQNRQDQG